MSVVTRSRQNGYEIAGEVTDAQCFSVNRATGEGKYFAGISLIYESMLMHSAPFAYDYGLRGPHLFFLPWIDPIVFSTLNLGVQGGLAT